MKKKKQKRALFSISPTHLINLWRSLIFCVSSFTYNVLLIIFMSLPTKRSATTDSATTSSASATAALSPRMKKAKSQAVACSLDSNKNGLHKHQQDFDPSNDVVFDPSSMVLDKDLKNDDPSSLPNARGAIANNLARKKATPPQPAKKLSIKIHSKIRHFYNEVYAAGSMYV